MYFLYFSDLNFEIPHYQSIRPCPTTLTEKSSIFIPQRATLDSVPEDDGDILDLEPIFKSSATKIIDPTKSSAPKSSACNSTSASIGYLTE